MKSTLFDAAVTTFMVVVMLMASGCVAGKHGDTLYISLFKDISAKGSVDVKADGTKTYNVDVTSDTNGGAMLEAIKAVKP